MNNSGLIWLANHLWQSTSFAGVVGCLALFLRGNSARVRYLLWLAASGKFLVPFALLATIGTQIPWPFGHAQATHIISTASQMVVQFTQFGRVEATAVVSHAESGEVFLTVLGVLWVLGTLAVLARAYGRWLRVRRAVHESMETSMAFVIPVRLSASKLEPAVVGILRPVLLLPKGLDLRLTPEEIRAVLAHECCHVAWKDNLAAALHMLVEAVFWFHPLIWWLGARLVDERERACDEQVLADGHSPTSYAEGILKVCEHFLTSRLLCVAGVGGANLSHRIEAIMKNRLIKKLGRVHKLLIVAMAGAAVIAPVAVGVLTSPRARAQPGVETRGDSIAAMEWLTRISGESWEWDVRASKVAVGATILDPMEAENVRLSHGIASLRADRAQARNISAKAGGKSTVDWTFAGHVRIEFLGGALQANEATAKFDGFHVTISTPNGRVSIGNRRGQNGAPGGTIKFVGSSVTRAPGGTFEVAGSMTLTLVATRDNLILATPGMITVGPAIRNNYVTQQQRFADP